MAKFVHILLNIATITATLSIAHPASAATQQDSFQLPDIQVPPILEPFKKELWNPQGLLMLVAGGGAAWWFTKEETNKKGKLATARWAGATEKSAARRIAIQQINERRRNGLTTWINSPKITPLTKPIEKKGKIVKRFSIKPQTATILIPDGQRGAAVCGAPGSGKTYSVIDPMIRSVVDQGFPIILYDFKFPGGQAETHAAYARKMGYDVRIFAPGFEGTESCNLLDFLKNAEDAETAGQIAKVLNKNFSLSGGKGGDDPFFQMSGDQLIKAVLQLAKLTQYADFLMCQKILSLDPSELIDRVKAADLSPWVRVSWEQFMSMRQSEKTSASVAATASLMFTNFVSPDILPCLCGESTIPLDLEGKQMLIFGMDQNRRDIIGPILATVLHMIVTRNVAKQRTDPLAVFLDELPTIALPSLVNWLNESRSAGFCGVLGYQNMTQLEKAYGKEVSRAVLSGCNTKFVFNPGEYESAEYFSKYLGDEEIHFKQKSRSSGKSGNSRSMSDQDRTKKIIAPDEILKLPSGSCIFINPAYANRQESNVPLRLRVRITKSELQKEEVGKVGFAKLIKKLKKQTKKRGVTVDDIRVREQELSRVIPPLPKEGEQKNNNAKPVATTLAELMQNAAEEFDAVDEFETV